MVASVLLLNAACFGGTYYYVRHWLINAAL